MFHDVMDQTVVVSQ